jgi:hypothetical protein
MVAMQGSARSALFESEHPKMADTDEEFERQIVRTSNVN